jgi:hypothetical protein
MERPGKEMMLLKGFCLTGVLKLPLKEESRLVGILQSNKKQQSMESKR